MWTNGWTLTVTLCDDPAQLPMVLDLRTPRYRHLIEHYACADMEEAGIIRGVVGVMTILGISPGRRPVRRRRDLLGGKSHSDWFVEDLWGVALR